MQNNVGNPSTESGSLTNGYYFSNPFLRSVTIVRDVISSQLHADFLGSRGEFNYLIARRFGLQF